MKFKVSPIVVPPDDPLQNDVLDRGPTIESIKLLLSYLSGPFVLGINSEWGMGKTTFIHMLMRSLEMDDVKCLYFDAWKNDYIADPIVGFLAEFDTLDGKTTAYIEHIDKAKKMASAIAKRAIPAGGKLLTAGLLDVEGIAKSIISEYAEDTLADAIDIYKAENTVIKEFHRSLENAVLELNGGDEKKQLIVFVDELDRCRPDFAIELLERIKHVFDIKNIIFVISMDKSQLNISLQSIYGKGMRSTEYLRRFIDLEFNLAPPSAEAFTQSLYHRYGFDEIFDKRDHHEFRHDADEFKETFAILSDLYKLSLRAREQCFTILAVALMLTPRNQYLYPVPLVTLVILKITRNELYKGFVYDDFRSNEIVKDISNMPGGEEFLFSHQGMMVEAYLIGLKTGHPYGMSPELEDYSMQVNEFEQSGNEDEPSYISRYRRILEMVQYINSNSKRPRLMYLFDKIELASQFKQ